VVLPRELALNLLLVLLLAEIGLVEQLAASYSLLDGAIQIHACGRQTRAGTIYMRPASNPLRRS
jgi:hypothetical protein